MKKTYFNNMLIKSCMAFVYAVLLCGLSTSCSKDDDDSDDESKHRRTATTFDDFAFSRTPSLMWIPWAISSTAT